MTNLSKLKLKIEKCGIPFRYDHWKDTPKAPYGVYICEDGNKFFADGKIWLKLTNVILSIYTEKKDRDAEKIIEKMLDELGLPWEKSETYIESERLFEVDYTCEVIFDE